MRYIEPPHIILRKALIAGMKFNTFAKDLGIFIARTLFGSSGLNLDGGSLRNNVAEWSQNNAMCALTEKVIFSDPYMDSSNNRWTTPQLDNYAMGIKADGELKLAAANLKSKFVTATQALLHGDLHTGSVMAKDGSTFVIDPEFAFYGPMGFDIGAILSNLFLSYFSQSAISGRTEYSEWILEQIICLHNTFTSEFLMQWSKSREDPSAAGELYPVAIYNGDMMKLAQKEFMADLWRDTLGFTGMKMIRRIVGIAHVEDMESIADVTARSTSEKRALLFARDLVVTSLRAVKDEDFVIQNVCGSTVTAQLNSIENVCYTLARTVNVLNPPDVWPL